MIRNILLALFGALVLAQALFAGEQRLTKSLLGLDDFYYAYQQSSAQVAQIAGSGADKWAMSLYRDAIQYELIDDTLWVKVFITTDPTGRQAANTEFKARKLRALSHFGNIYAARIDLRQLPELDRLPFVQFIEPVVPDGSTARASVASIPVESSVKKK